MRAAVLDRIGDIDDLSVREIAEPMLAPGQVRIGVHAVGLNFPDLLNIRGQYQHKPRYPLVPGMECAGEVLEIADDVEGFNMGDRVMAQTRTGSLAEEVCVTTESVYPLHAGMGFTEAAGFAVAYGTSLHALSDRARIRPGESLLVLGASGGIGLTAVELGSLLGARVIAAASSDEKLELCRRYGADECINYSLDSLRDSVLDMTQGRGVDVAYDPVGGDPMFQALRCMAEEGRLLILGFASGRIADIPANRLLLRQCQAVGVAFGTWSRTYPDLCRERLAVLSAWHRKGLIKPHVSQVFDLGDIRKALHLMAGRQARGKVVVTVRPPKA